MSLLDHPYTIFYISHFLDPFLLYCFTYNALFAIGVALLWEFFEYGLFHTFGNYSILFLEEFSADGQLESIEDILFYDIGGAVVAVFLARGILKLVQAPPAKRFSVQWKAWPLLLLFLAKTLLLSPVASVGWDCIDMLEDWCLDNGRMLLPWGMFVIAPVNTAFILWFYNDDQGPTKWYILITAWLLFATAFQTIVPGAFVALVLFSVAALGLWLYSLVRPGRYTRLGAR